MYVRTCHAIRFSLKCLPVNVKLSCYWTPRRTISTWGPWKDTLGGAGPVGKGQLETPGICDMVCGSSFYVCVSFVLH